MGPGWRRCSSATGRWNIVRPSDWQTLDARTPITPETQFLLASVTKQFTATAIMILAERGKLQFDDPLAKFCPEFPAYAKTITIRHLLNHTAGLTQYQELLVGKVGADYFRSSKGPRAAHEFTAAEALQALSRQEKLRFTPGARNLNTAIPATSFSGRSSNA